MNIIWHCYATVITSWQQLVAKKMKIFFLDLWPPQLLPTYFSGSQPPRRRNPRGDLDQWEVDVPVNHSTEAPSSSPSVPSRSHTHTSVLTVSSGVECCARAHTHTPVLSGVWMFALLGSSYKGEGRCRQRLLSVFLAKRKKKRPSTTMKESSLSLEVAGTCTTRWDSLISRTATRLFIHLLTCNSFQCCVH